MPPQKALATQGQKKSLHSAGAESPSLCRPKSTMGQERKPGKSRPKSRMGQEQTQEQHSVKSKALSIGLAAQDEHAKSRAKSTAKNSILSLF